MVCTSVEGNGSIVFTTAFLVYITYCYTNFMQVILTVTNAASEATGYRLSHLLKLGVGPNFSEQHPASLVQYWLQITN